jgi:hypothetical protein
VVGWHRRAGTTRCTLDGSSIPDRRRWLRAGPRPARPSGLGLRRRTARGSHGHLRRRAR